MRILYQLIQRFRIQGTGFRIQDTRFRIQGSRDPHPESCNLHLASCDLHLVSCILHPATYRVACLIILSSLTTIVQSQDLARIGKSNSIKVSGGISANQIFYWADGIQNRRTPYSYFLTGNVNFNIYELNIPVSFTFSNQTISVQQPFNQYSIHPTYKWVTGHIGYTSISFSPYTLNGHIFLGTGVDATPSQKWKVSAMYGRLLRAVQPDTTDARNQPAFERWGYGVKTHYGDNLKFIDLTIFRAKDMISSLPYVPESLNILPQENLVLSIGGGLSFLERFQVKYEIASSGITGDTRAERASPGNVFEMAGPLFTPRASTSYYKAMKGAFNYNGKGFIVGVGYERIDPQYKTLGAYFFNNDLENITINGNIALAGGKVNLGVSVGTQRDNLDNNKISTMSRSITSVNVGFVPSQRLNISTSYSNFLTYTNIRSPFLKINQLTPYDNLDTLNYTQLSQNANANINYIVSASKERRKSLNVNISYMKASDTQANVPQNSGTTFLNLNTAYSVSITPKKLTISPAFNMSKSTSMGTNSLTLGPSVTISKSSENKKLRGSFTANGNQSYAESRLTSQVITFRLTGGYTVQKKHNLNVSLVALNRSGEGLATFNEFTGTVGYAYSFSK